MIAKMILPFGVFDQQLSTGDRSLFILLVFCFTLNMYVELLCVFVFANRRDEVDVIYSIVYPKHFGMNEVGVDHNLNGFHSRILLHRLVLDQHLIDGVVLKGLVKKSHTFFARRVHVVSLYVHNIPFDYVMIIAITIREVSNTDIE